MYSLCGRSGGLEDSAGGSDHETDYGLARHLSL